MPEETRGGWLFDQVKASAGRLTNRPPSLLSPTARALTADITAWIEAYPIAQQQPQCEVRLLRVVHDCREPESTNPQHAQLPLMMSVSDS